MVSAREEEERISSPMETVIFENVSALAAEICLERERDGSEEGKAVEKARGRVGERTDIFQHLHLGAYALQVLIVLVFEFGQYGVAVLTSVHHTTPHHHQPLALTNGPRSSFLPLDSPSSFPLTHWYTPAPSLSPSCNPVRSIHTSSSA